MGGLLAADESEGGEGNEPASQARRELCRPLTGPSVSPVHPASLALTLCLIHMSCGEVRAAVLVYVVQLSSVRDAPLEGSVLFSSSQLQTFPWGKSQPWFLGPSWLRRQMEERGGGKRPTP